MRRLLLAFGLASHWQECRADMKQIVHDLRQMIPLTIFNQSFIEEQELMVEYSGPDVFREDRIHVIGNKKDKLPLPPQALMEKEMGAWNDRGIHGMPTGGGGPQANAALGTDQWLINDLVRYGCWCFLEFDADHGKGSGHPINEVDNLCKILADGYSCVIMDFQVDGTECIPWRTEYVSGFTGFLGFFGTVESHLLACEQRNPDPCAMQACQVEGAFVRELLREVSVNGYFDLSYQHAGGFDHEEHCPRTGQRHSSRGCCGDVPFRYPYSTKDGNSGCCGSNIYQKDMFECCEDYSVQFTCS